MIKGTITQEDNYFVVETEGDAEKQGTLTQKFVNIQDASNYLVGELGRQLEVARRTAFENGETPTFNESQLRVAQTSTVDPSVIAAEEKAYQAEKNANNDQLKDKANTAVPASQDQSVGPNGNTKKA